MYIYIIYMYIYIYIYIYIHIYITTTGILKDIVYMYLRIEILALLMYICSMYYRSVHYWSVLPRAYYNKEDGYDTIIRWE